MLSGPVPPLLNLLPGTADCPGAVAGSQDGWCGFVRYGFE
ncbi:hypothetical protein SFOMI_4473 [Sphingobium fuliginis]|uniref:Uncharacterized protein n=1 Tax=Sphingobium fuliginis (strain ATCC 27551) TaxID=336203 RepID=A0A292ZM36_SPHSA|nr:hypothetical protein SFOMI_4473 [Sphingobium fuliginis]